MSSSETAIAALDAGRDRFLGVYEAVPEAALAFLKPGDDYSLGGLIVHVNGALQRYADVLDAIWTAGGEVVDAGEIDARLIQANDRARAGLDGVTRQRELDVLHGLHQRVLAGLAEIPDAAWETKTPVIYHGSDTPYPTAAGDIAKWLIDHYEEHVPQIPELLSDWSAGQP